MQFSCGALDTNAMSQHLCIQIREIDRKCHCCSVLRAFPASPACQWTSSLGSICVRSDVPRLTSYADSVLKLFTSRVHPGHDNAICSVTVCDVSCLQSSYQAVLPLNEHEVAMLPVLIMARCASSICLSTESAAKVCTCSSRSRCYLVMQGNLTSTFMSTMRQLTFKSQRLPVSGSLTSSCHATLADSALDGNHCRTQEMPAICSPHRQLRGEL